MFKVLNIWICKLYTHLIIRDINCFSIEQDYFSMAYLWRFR